MPLSRDPRRRARQLANLKPGKPPPIQPGEQRALKHGGYARVASDRLEAKVREVFDALSEDAPLRETDGSLPAAHGAMVRLAADCMCRLDTVSQYLVERGHIDHKGELRLAVLALESRLRHEAEDHLDALGMSPRSQVRLGLDVARTRTFDLAQHWAGQDASAIIADGEVVDEG